MAPDKLRCRILTGRLLDSYFDEFVHPFINSINYVRKSTEHVMSFSDYVTYVKLSFHGPYTDYPNVTRKAKHRQGLSLVFI